MRKKGTQKYDHLNFFFSNTGHPCFLVGFLKLCQHHGGTLQVRLASVLEVKLEKLPLLVSMSRERLNYYGNQSNHQLYHTRYVPISSAPPVSRQSPSITIKFTGGFAAFLELSLSCELSRLPFGSTAIQGF